MSEETEKTPDPKTGNDDSKETAARTFTQDEVNSILKTDREKNETKVEKKATEIAEKKIREFRADLAKSLGLDSEVNPGEIKNKLDHADEITKRQTALEAEVATLRDDNKKKNLQIEFGKLGVADSALDDAITLFLSNTENQVEPADFVKTRPHLLGAQSSAKPAMGQSAGNGNAPDGDAATKKALLGLQTAGFSGPTKKTVDA